VATAGWDVVRMYEYETVMHAEFWLGTSWNAFTLTSRRRKEYGSATGLRETGCKDQRWMGLAQDRVKWRILTF
jgi:hypothetical protein